MSETETKKQLTTFLDLVGRTIIGEEVVEKSSTEVLAVKNPVILHVVPQGNSGAMNVQFVPLFFREFLADATDDVVFFYNRSTITTTSVDAFDFRLQTQYNQLFNKSNVFVPPGAGKVATPQSTGSGNIVDLFDK